MAKAKFKHLYSETYRQNIYYVACSPKEYIKLIQHEFNCVPDVSAKKQGAKFEVYIKKDVEICVIWITDKKRLDFLAHECMHATHYILANRGLWLTDSSEEAYAYLMQWIVSNILGI